MLAFFLKYLVSTAIVYSRCKQDNRKFHISVQEILEKATTTLFARKKKGIFVQVGSNTLDNNLNFNDPIMSKLSTITNWTKYFIEPIPHLYRQLERNVKAIPNAFAVNIAISENASMEEGETTMYCPRDDPSSAHWLNQVCSFDVNHVLKSLRILKKENEVPEEHRVRAWSFPMFLQRYNISDIDLLLIDTEGFDYDVLKQVKLLQ